MALVITHNPPQYASANGDALFTVYEATKANDTATYPGYRYIADIYIGGLLVQRLKATPHPVHRHGIFNIGKVVRNYIAPVLTPAAGIVMQQMGTGQFFAEAEVRFGEEYNFTTYTNLLTDSIRRYYNHFEDRLITTHITLANRVNATATNRPAVSRLKFSDEHYLIPLFSVSSVFSITITAYTGTNVTATISDSIAVTAGALQLLNLSPAAINAAYPGTITSATTVYTVAINSSTMLRFDITCEPRHTPHQLHFLNQYGGWETFTFFKKSATAYEGEKKTYTQLPYRVSNAGAVSYNTDNVLHDGLTTYAATFRKKTKLWSYFLSDAEYRWLRELIYSPSVYVKEGGYFIPVSITGTGYEEKKIVNDRLQTLQIEIDYGHPQNTQAR